MTAGRKPVDKRARSKGRTTRADRIYPTRPELKAGDKIERLTIYMPESLVALLRREAVERDDVMRRARAKGDWDARASMKGVSGIVVDLLTKHYVREFAEKVAPTPPDYAATDDGEGDD